MSCILKSSLLLVFLILSLCTLLSSAQSQFSLTAYNDSTCLYPVALPAAVAGWNQVTPCNVSTLNNTLALSNRCISNPHAGVVSATYDCYAGIGLNVAEYSTAGCNNVSTRTFYSASYNGGGTNGSTICTRGSVVQPGLPTAIPYFTYTCPVCVVPAKSGAPNAAAITSSASQLVIMLAAAFIMLLLSA